MANGDNSPAGNELSLPFVKFVLESAVIDYENFGIQKNLQVQEVTNLPVVVTTVATTITTTTTATTTEAPATDGPTDLSSEDFLAVVSAITDELPEFNLNAIFGASTPTDNRPAISGAQAVVNAEVVEAFKSVEADSVVVNSIGNRPGRPGAAQASQNVGSDQKYFQSVVTTLPTATATTASTAGKKCRKCDALSYAGCITLNTFETCGDDEVCFLTLREENGVINSVCSGCKAETACEDGRKQNFVSDGAQDADATRFDQCKPGLAMSTGRWGKVQSVCRHCFAPASTTDATMTVGNVSESLKPTVGSGIISGATDAQSKTRVFWINPIL